MSSFDYSQLMPVGFDAVTTMQGALTDASDVLGIIFSHPIIGISNNNESDAEPGIIGSIYRQLEEVRGSVYGCAAIPVASLMSTISYSQTLITSAGKTSNVDDATLIETLSTVAETWTGIDTIGACEKSEVAKFKLLGVIQALSDHQSDVDDVIVALQNTILPGSPNERDEDLNADINSPMFKLFSDTFLPLGPSLEGILKDRTEMRLRIANVIGLPLIEGDYKYLEISFPEAVKKIPESAVLIVNSVSDYHAQVIALRNQVEGLQNHLDTLVISTSNLASAVIRVPANIDAFSHSANSKNLKSSNASKQIVVIAWKSVLSTATTFSNDIGIILPSSPVPSPVPSSTTLVAFPNKNRRIAIASRYTEATTRAILGDPSAHDIDDAFGPPAGTDATLPNLSQICTDIYAHFRAILQTPFSDEVKVTTKQGAELTVQSMVTVLEQNFLNVQNASLVFTRGLRTYAFVVGETLLPHLQQKKKGVTIDDYLALTTDMWRQSKNVADETTKAMNYVLGPYNISVNNLRLALEDIGKQLEQLKKEIKTASEDKQTSIITIVVEAIGALILIGGAVGSSHAPGAAAAWYITLGLAGYGSIKLGVEKFVKTGRTQVLMSNMESLFKQTKTTYNRLAELIQLFTQFTDSTKEVTAIWASIKASIDAVKKDKVSWEKPGIFNRLLVKLAQDNWKRMEKACDAFALMVANPTDGINVIIVTNASTALARLEQKYGITIPKSSKTKPRTFAVNAGYPERIRSLMDENAQIEIVDFLSAPDIAIGTLRPDDIQVLMSNYFLLATSLNNVGLSDLSQRCTELQKLLVEKVQPAIREAIVPLFNFASAQPAVPTIPATAEIWNNFVTLKNQDLQQGNAAALAADETLRTMQQTLELVNNDVIAKMNEVQTSLVNTQRLLDEARSDYASYSWMKFVPVLNLIELLVEKIKGSEEQINNYNTQMRQLQSIASTLSNSVQISQQLFIVTSSIAGAWSKMTTATYVAANLWEKFETYPQAEVELAKKTWISLQSQLEKWI